MSKRERVVNELIQTEKSFIFDLFAVTEGFSDIIVRFHCQHSEVQVLFNILTSIRRFNRKLLKGFCKAGTDIAKVGDVFTHNQRGFAVYFNYCAYYPRAVNSLADLRKNQKFEAALLKRQQELEVVLPLESYFLKPLQRLLKYPLLIRRLLETLCENPVLSHNEFLRLQKGHDVVTKVSAKLNEYRKKLDVVQTDTNKAVLNKFALPGSCIGCFRLAGPNGLRRNRSADSLRTLVSYDKSA